MSGSGAKKEGAFQRIEWDIDVSLLGNWVVVRQLALIIVIPSAFVGLLIFSLGIIDNNVEEMKIAGFVFLLSLAVMLGLIGLAVLVVFGNRMSMHFIVDELGVQSLVIDRRAFIGRRLSMLLGALTLNPRLAGAGLLAEANSGRTTGWKDIAKLELIPEQKTIVLRGKRLVLDAIFCNSETYEPVLSFVRDKTGKSVRK